MIGVEQEKEDTNHRKIWCSKRYLFKSEDGRIAYSRYSDSRCESDSRHCRWDKGVSEGTNPSDACLYRMDTPYGWLFIVAP